MNSENKTCRRVYVLQSILHQQKLKNVSQNLRTSRNSNIEICVPPTDLQQPFNTIFTQPALKFLSEIICEFDHQINELHWKRLNSTIQRNTNFETPRFLNSNQRRSKEWKIKPLPNRLLCRHIDLGDVSPSNTDHFIESLKTDVQGVQVDFDDGHCPTWRNQIIGYYNIYRVVHGLIKEVGNITDIPILMLRPRAWNMTEHNIMINGKKTPGALVDFALLMFHVAQKLAETSSGPFFYLSKLEGASEARLWNDIFIWVQNRLQIPQGTIKACVLIENILSSFELDEILYELRDHSLGLNCGIWDYAASIINKFGESPNFILPDRNKYVNMGRHFLKKYVELVVETCHLRGAPATGGMVALLVPERNAEEIIFKATNLKLKEIQIGCDGFLIYDRKLIPSMKKLWKNNCSASNQISNNLPLKCRVTEADLLKMPQGSVTMDGLRHNTAVAISYIYYWLEGKGHFFYKGAVEDSATAEISRSQIWQWIRHKAKIEEYGDSVVTKTLVEQISKDFIQECTYFNEKNLLMSRKLFMDIVTSGYFIQFITTYLNDNCLVQNQQ